MNRGELADRVVVANLEGCGLAVKFQIRGCGADHREREDSIALADDGEAFDDDARADDGAGANFYVRADHRARADFDARVEFGALVDDRGGMDSDGYGFCSWISIADNSASAASSSPT